MNEIALQSAAAGFDALGLESVKADLQSIATALSAPTRLYFAGGGDINEALAGLAASTLTTANRVVYTLGGGVLGVDADLTFDGTNFAHGGAGTFATGTGAVSLNGSTTIPTGKTLTITDITVNRVWYSGTAGLLTGSANLTFNGTNFAHGGSGTFATGTGQTSVNGAMVVTGSATFNGTAFIINATTTGIDETVTRAVTSSPVNVLLCKAKSTTTPAAGFGCAWSFRADSDTVVDRTLLEVNNTWVVATDASRTSRSIFYQYDTTAREVLRFEASGSAAMIGFLGASAIVRPSSTTDLRQALIDLGLYTTGGASPLNLNGGAFTAQTVTISGLTSGRVPYVTTAGLITDSAGLRYSSQILNVGDGTVANTLFTVDGTAGSQRYMQFRSGTSPRWEFRVTNTAESGSDAGSNFALLAFTDAGVNIDIPITIVRATGGSITFARPTTQAFNWSQTGATTVSTGTGAVSLNGSTTVVTGKTLTVTDLSANRIIYSSGSGLLTISSNLTFDGSSVVVGLNLSAGGKIASTKASAAANITDANSSLKLYDSNLGAGLFGMQTSGSPYAYQIQVADSTMASKFPLSLNPLGGVVNIGAAPVVVSATGGISGVTTLVTTGILTVNSDTDGTTILGRTKIGSPSTDQASFSHFDHQSTTNFALIQDNVGGTTLNVATGRTLDFAVNGSSKMNMTSGGFNIGSALVTSLANTTDASSLTVASTVLSGGLAVTKKIWCGNEVRINGTSPQHWLTETDASADNGKWVWLVSAEVIKLRVLNDAESVAADIFSCTRSGTTVGTLTIGAATTQATNWSQTGATTFSTGTGAVSLNGTVTIASAGTVTMTRTVAATSTASGTWDSTVASSGTPAAGFGNALILRASSATVASRGVYEADAVWVVATDATRTGRVIHYTFDYGGARECIRMEGSGTASMIGFLGASAIVRPSSTTDLRTALINLGLYTTGGASPLNLNGGAFIAQTATISGLTTGRNIVASTAGLLVDSASWLWSATIGITSSSSGDSNKLEVSDAGTTNAAQALMLTHTSSGTPAAGFGSYLMFGAKSATVAGRFQSLWQSEWVVATDASRTAKMRLFAYDTAAREGLCIQASGSAAMIGFLGSAATVKATITGSRAANAALASLLTELAAKGLVTDGTTV